jgi:hypothetical protein
MGRCLPSPMFGVDGARDIQSSGPAAFTAPDLEMSPEIVGNVSLYHSTPGVLCVAALLADAQADEVRRRRAIEHFVAAAATEEARAERVFGLSVFSLAAASCLILSV